MNRIGFLACADTLPGEGPGGRPRRGDAFEHDLEVAALRPAFAEAGLELVELDWRAPLSEFDGIALVLLGTAWDYQDHPEEFLAKLEALTARGIVVCNPPEVVRWNADKTYLRELGDQGAPIVPTLYLDDAGCDEVTVAMASLDTHDVVVKRQIGAGGLGQHRFTCDTPPERNWRMGRPCMVQPFLPSVTEEGEYSFVFIDGAFSHAIRKRAAAGEYRIQSLYGGSETIHQPSLEDLDCARQVLTALPFMDLLYARIDMIRLPDDRLAVMEAELIEPYLYPEQGPDLGKRMAAAIARRLS